MRIVQICPYDLDRPGGVQRHILSLAAELRARGHEVAIVAPGPARSRPKPDHYYEGRKRAIGLSGTRFEVSYIDASAWYALEQKLDRRGMQLYHFHTIWTPLMPYQIFSKCRGARVATFHDTPPITFAGRLLRLAFMGMSRWFLKRLDGAIAVSEAPAGHLRPGRHGIEARIIPPACDFEEFRDVYEPDRAAREGLFRVLFVGRLETRKGVLSLLEAWGLLPDMLPAGARPLELVIAGEGPLRATAEEAVALLPEQNVRFETAPSERDVSALMKQSDVLVAPSLYGESFGIVLVEAMAAGLPVVAADNAGYTGVMAGGGESRLYKAGDARALAERIAVLVENAEAREEASAWGRSHAAQYDVSEVATDIEEVYEAALENRRRTAR